MEYSCVDLKHVARHHLLARHRWYGRRAAAHHAMERGRGGRKGPHVDGLAARARGERVRRVRADAACRRQGQAPSAREKSLEARENTNVQVAAAAGRGVVDEHVVRREMNAELYQGAVCASCVSDF